MVPTLNYQSLPSGNATQHLWTYKGSGSEFCSEVLPSPSNREDSFCYLLAKAYTTGRFYIWVDQAQGGYQIVPITSESTNPTVNDQAMTITSAPPALAQTLAPMAGPQGIALSVSGLTQAGLLLGGLALIGAVIGGVVYLALRRQRDFEEMVSLAELSGFHDGEEGDESELQYNSNGLGSNHQ